MTYRIIFDDSAGVWETYAEHDCGAWEWIAACETRDQAQARARMHARARG